MTVQDLIDLLRKTDPDAIVKAYDDLENDYVSVTGVEYDADECVIHTDDIS